MRVLARVAIVGAAGLQGRELTEEFAQSDLAAAQLVLLDAEDRSGEITEVGDEPALVMGVDRASFEGVDVAIFAGRGEQMAEHMEWARNAGAGVVDATGHSTGVPVRAAGLQPVEQLSLNTNTVAAAHPAATMIARLLAASPAQQSVPVFATVLLPASDGGRPAMDELQQQAVNLLAFQSIPTDIFGSQVAFNLLPRLSGAGAPDLSALASRIERETSALLGLAVTLHVQVIQVPVFVGIGVAVSAGGDAVASAALEESSEDEPATVLNVAGTGTVRMERQGSAGAFLVADNLKLTAHNCIQAATELLRLRPRGGVQ